MALLPVTRRGTDLALTLGLRLASASRVVTHYVPCRFGVRGTSPNEAIPFDGQISAVAPRVFREHHEIIFVGAAGIAMRVFGPLVRDKTKDPAVVVVDERGTFVVSLLSGHLGGANSLAREVAGITGGQPVITTASDLAGLPALDVLAAQIGMTWEPPRGFTKVMSRLISGDRVTFRADPRFLRSSEPLAQALPALGAEPEECKPATGLLVAVSGDPETRADVYLRPRDLVVGIGCRRGVNQGEILEAVATVLAGARLAMARVKALATIDAKAGEAGLIEAASRLGVPLLLINQERLRAFDGSYRPSTFVEARMGVGGVCQPAAMAAALEPVLLVEKQRINRVTVAVAREGCWWSAQGPETPAT
ncbi:MAG: cobalt-precorrin 5A hydrolase [Bacillota bacterium]